MNHELSNLNVYYGWSVLNKIRRKRSVSILFDNNQTDTDRKANFIKKMQTTCYVRRQTVAEVEDGKQSNRILTGYSLFLDEKPFSGDVELLLETNYQADINNVPEPVLIEIKEALRKAFRSAYFQKGKV